ncbi:MAG: tetratricopeptide repeat protein [Bacteroidales bacterium]|nr:tetratricopeptide repeat protein [Bacteroidales bacterium]
MQENYNKIRLLTEEENYFEALSLVENLLTEYKNDDMLWYLRGNIFKKQEKWKQAIDSYTEAISLNPKNPATTMRRICIDILNFYDKTMYNP